MSSGALIPRTAAAGAIASPALLALARQALREAETLPDLARLVDQAEVVRLAARKATLTKQAQDDWGQYALDAKRKAEFGNISKEQFMAILQGSKPEEAALNAQVQGAEDFYKTGLTLLKQLSRVVVEVNIMSITKTGDNMAMNVMVTAKNISSPTGGAFANSTLQVARRGSDKTDNAAMLGALIKDAYEQMSQEFLPQVIKEMSIVDAAGGKLVAYDLVLQGFDSNDARSVRNGLKKENADNFRYIDYNNELSQLEPPMNIIYVRWNGKPSGLADKVMESLDGAGLKFSEPIVTPTVRDLVFVKQAKD